VYKLQQQTINFRHQLQATDWKPETDRHMSGERRKDKYRPLKHTGNVCRIIWSLASKITCEHCRRICTVLAAVPNGTKTNVCM